MEVCPLGKNPMAHVGGGGAEQGYCTKQGSTLSLWPSWIRWEIAVAAGEASRLAGGSPEGGENARKRGRTVSPSASAARMRDAARAIGEMRGVKVHRQEMVHNLITGMGEAVLKLECGEEGLDTLCSVLTKVGEGDLDEEDDGYYSSSDEEGVVTE